MKKYVWIILLMSGAMQAQVFSGKGDLKFQMGGNFQEHGSGIISSLDYGLGSNMSIGFSASYILGVTKIAGEKPDFDDRMDAKIRFNANIADVFNIEEKMDIYPGLNIGTRNFGGHLGARYFFTKGFGIYSEMQFPIAKYETDPIGFENYNNQFNFSIGASFNL
ncbi:DUF6646 family protein [Flavobacterium sp.]|uniref:DUF6646 family protein n=1 Tax=Flavobacterium sp. TaxID=239 RepID=UPI0028BD50A9|nr:DUF6646 family protein [Flavobacterium sp.]